MENEKYDRDEASLSNERDYSYSKYVTSMWEMSHELESKLGAVMLPENPMSDKSEPDTRLHSELEHLVERFNDILSRINL